MKTIKILFASVFFLSIISCGSDDNPIAIELTTANLAGTYKISSYSEQKRKTTQSNNTTVNISNTSIAGDTFQVDFVLNANGTFTANGQYRITSTTTPNGGQPQTSSEILLVDSAGTYSINTTSGIRSLNFTATNGDFLLGNYAVNLFNQNNLALKRESESTDGQIKTESDLLIGFSRQ